MTQQSQALDDGSSDEAIDENAEEKQREGVSPFSSGTRVPASCSDDHTNPVRGSSEKLLRERNSEESSWLQRSRKKQNRSLQTGG